ncbi:ABC transporter permease subunit [Bacillus andreraoultii]|uniref:ABC transporter permease subunit n=1 Tax=Bacillus andreraoultii TaxID=1499685 RepID=UPI001CA3052E|nr:ABC transporter permease subunit [Bacillus andreraoultii]
MIQFLNKSIPAIKSMLDFLESIPDLILATLLQMFSIYIFKKTGISFFAVAAYQEPIYFAPIVTLSILPAISMCKILTHLIEEESLKQYVLFVKGKGIRKIVVLVKHILRNIFPDFSHRLKLIIWGMLSSQFIIERIFNVQGLTFYLVESFTPITIFTALFLIFTPFYLLFSILDFIVEKDQYESNPIQGVCRRKKSGVKAVVINGIDNLHVTFRQQFRHFIKMIKRKSCFLKDCFLKENFLLLKQGGDSCGRSTSRRPCRSEFEQRATKRLRPCPRKASALVNNNKVFENSQRKRRWDSVRLYLKNWKILVGASFFIFVISYSFSYSMITNDHVDQVKLLYDQNGALIAAPPYPPTEPFIFGSDKFGYSIFDQLIVGAKYTLLFGMLIALLRVIGGLIFGSLYAFWLNRTFQKGVDKLTESLHYVPLSLIALILLAPVLMSSGPLFAFSQTERMLIEIVILTILVVPLTTVLIGKDIQGVLRQEFIKTARTLGGSNTYIFFRHVMPHIRPKLAILFGQQFIQVLVVFIHLGMFELYFGGTKVSLGSMPSKVSVTYEWSGLIGAIARGALRSEQYWYLSIFVAFLLAIFAMQFILRGLIEIGERQQGVVYPALTGSKASRLRCKQNS